MKKLGVLFFALLLLLAAPLCAVAAETGLAGEFVVDAAMALEREGNLVQGRYSGQIVDGLPDGQGTFAGEDWTYAGAWAQGLRQGWGVTVYDDGSVQAGEYLLDELSDAEEGAAALPDGAEDYAPLAKGDRGDAVLALQERLAELKYLSGKQDGIYGSKTEAAVAEFQKASGLEATGGADTATQAALFSTDEINPDPTADSAAYAKLDYAAVARDPDRYNGTQISFSGRVIQSVEGLNGTLYRIATSGEFGDIVYVDYVRPAGEKRVLEGDEVNVLGTCGGVKTYKNALGDMVTIPACAAQRIEIK